MVHFGYLLAFIWGCLYALFLHGTPWGRTLFVHLTWLATTIGVAVNLLILFTLSDAGMVSLLNVFAVFALSGVGIAAAGLWELHTTIQRIIRGGE